jgi:hypothetical protein
MRLLSGLRVRVSIRTIKENKERRKTMEKTIYGIQVKIDEGIIPVKNLTIYKEWIILDTLIQTDSPLFKKAGKQTKMLIEGASTPYYDCKDSGHSIILDETVTLHYINFGYNEDKNDFRHCVVKIGLKRFQ